ncbi:tyrosine-type recombinase/integrase [Kordiimonas sediminis]|uniref:tyrosine-type recombinase/integrase n=1 Tax=Kordiimonas sediminis TaxID=1735581 RepID=UPI00174849CE|nr:tyrosine-type recombinase/integrase [Kordiimonas sediminis]
MHFHDLRHSFASLVVSQGLSLPMIGKLLRHSQVQTTARYAHLQDTALQQASIMIGSAIATEGP